MQPMLVDSHCHLDCLDYTPWGGDPDGPVRDAHEQGIGHMLCISINLENYPKVLDYARRNQYVSASVGVHPNEREGEEPTVGRLVSLAKADKVIAIGETGLDYFRSEGDLEWQRERFRRHIAASKITRKPLIIHMREATEDTLRILKEEGADEIGGVMHCFVENWDVAQKAMDLNLHISFSGIVTFKSAQDLKEVARRMPLERMLVETDSPYLAPVPHRSKPNYPSYVRHVAECIAELRAITIEAVSEQTTENFFSLFGVDRRVVA